MAKNPSEVIILLVALFAIGGALIFNEATHLLAPADKHWVAGRVGFYSLLILIGALWGGAYVLNFFGVSLAALRIAGGASEGKGVQSFSSSSKRGTSN